MFALVPGAIRGLGQSTGFTMELLNSNNMSQQAFEDARDKLEFIWLERVDDAIVQALEETRQPVAAAV